MKRFLIFFVSIFFLSQGISYSQDKTLNLTLKDAISIALKRNLSIAESKEILGSSTADVLIREGEFDPAFKAGLNLSNTKSPTVSVVASEEERATSYEVGFGGKLRTGTIYELKWSGGKVKRSETPFLKTNPYYFSDLSLSLTQPLLKGFGRPIQESNLEVAKNSVSISTLNLRNRASAVITDTASAYWGLYRAKSALKSAELSLELAKSLQAEIKARIEAGALAPVEIYKADAEVAIRQEALISARKAVYDAEDALRSIMNIEDWDVEIEISSVPQEPEEIFEEFSTAFDEALQSRPDYKSALIEKKNRSILKEYFNNQRLPSLDLSVSSGLSGINGSFGGAFDETTSGDYYSWMVGLTLNIPLENKTARGSYLKARHEEEIAEINLRALRQKIASEVREAIRAVRLSRESVLAARATLSASKTRLEAEQEKFKLGMATINDVLSFQREYSNSISALDKALSEYSEAVLMLKKAKGEILNWAGIASLP